jgi:hypothetical protein
VEKKTRQGGPGSCLPFFVMSLMARILGAADHGEGRHDPVMPS